MVTLFPITVKSSTMVTTRHYEYIAYNEINRNAANDGCADDLSNPETDAIFCI